MKTAQNGLHFCILKKKKMLEKKKKEKKKKNLPIAPPGPGE